MTQSLKLEGCLTFGRNLTTSTVSKTNSICIFSANNSSFLCWVLQCLWNTTLTHLILTLPQSHSPRGVPEEGTALHSGKGGVNNGKKKKKNRFPSKPQLLNSLCMSWIFVNLSVDFSMLGCPYRQHNARWNVTNSKSVFQTGLNE